MSRRGRRRGGKEQFGSAAGEKSGLFTNGDSKHPLGRLAH